MTNQSISAGETSGATEKIDKVEISVRLDPDLLDQIQHLTQDPSKVIEVAVRQWLRGGTSRDDDLARPLSKNPPVPPRGEWND